MFNYYMTTKGFAGNETNIETPNDVVDTKKPLKSDVLTSGRVDINKLKSRLQETESKELKKNLLTLTFLILALSILGVYLSL